MNTSKVDIRIAIGKLAKAGDSAAFTGPFPYIEQTAKPYARRLNIPVLIVETPTGATVTRIDAPPPKGLHSYPQIAALEPGASVLIEVDPLSHQRVRLAASNLGAKLGLVFRCTRTGNAIKVTRTDGPGEQLPATRASKYNLERLATERELRFSLPPEEQHRLRLAATYKARMMRWKIRCRLQDDGTMLVYRTDPGAPAAASDSPANPAPTSI